MKNKKPIDFVLLIIVFIMLALGIIMVMSASSPTSLAETGSSYSYVKKQAISAVIGLVAMFIISHIDYKFYKTRIVNLTEEYSCIQSSSSTCFFKVAMSVLSGERRLS